MKKRTALGLAVSVATSYPVTLNALGLGELQSSSQLNQPLNAQIELLSTNAKQVGKLQVKLASADVFNRVGIDRPAYLNSLKFRTTTKNGKPFIVVSSNKPVQEPFLNFLLEVSWPQGQLLKEYTVLLDPPVLMQAGDTAPQNVASVRAEPKSSGVVNRADVNKLSPPQSQRKQESVLEAQAKLAAQEEQQQGSRSSANTASKTPVRTSRRSTAATSTSGGKKYRVRRGDTMQRVTARLRYSGTTNSQMMLALFKANPHAFARNNINYLKTGAVLTQPPRSAVSADSKSSARAQIKQHYVAWKQYRKGLGSKTVAQQRTSTKRTSATSSATNNQNTSNTSKTSAKNSTAKLSVVGSKPEAATANSASGAGSPVLQKKLTLVEEALASTSSKNAELESRIGKLEAIVRKKDRLITLKNERLAHLESQLASPEGVNKSLANEAITTTQVTPTSVNEAQDLATNVANEADQKNNLIIRDDETSTANVKGTDAAQIAAAVDSAISTTDKTNIAANTEKNVEKITPTRDHETVAEASTEKPAVATPVDDKTTTESSLLDLLKSPLVAAIGGSSLLALILGGLFLRRRQALAAEADNEFITSGDEDFDLTDESFDFDTKLDSYEGEKKEPEPNKNIQGDGFAPNLSKTVSKPEVNEVVEEDELDKVLSADASLDDDEVLQEADVYIVYGLHEQAEEELKKAISEKPSKLEYRYKLLENYQVADDSEAFVASAKDFLKAEGDNKQELWEKIVELGKKVAPENDMFAEKSSTKAAAVFAGVVVAATAAATAGFAASDTNTENVTNISEKIDNGLSTGLDGAISNDEFESLLNSDLDFDDLDLSDMGNSDISLGDTIIDDKLDNDLDLSEFSDLSADDKFDFEGLDSLEGLGGLDELGALDEVDVDNSNILNFKDAESTGNTEAVTSLNLEIDSNTGLDKVLPTGSYSSSFDDDKDNDALSFLNLPDDDQEMQDAHIGTKLDLARAYLDMGDVEGARCTLEEVVIEGNETQKREAEEMLLQTG